jgi:hypothetical protein
MIAAASAPLKPIVLPTFDTDERRRATLLLYLVRGIARTIRRLVEKPGIGYALREKLTLIALKMHTRLTQRTNPPVTDASLHFTPNLARSDA